MKFSLKLLLAGMALLWQMPSWGLTFTDFPPYLQSILTERLATLQTNNGFCIAGQVKFSDGVYIGGASNVLVNFEDGVDEPLQVYSNGWFIDTRTEPLAYAVGGHVALRAFEYNAIDSAVKPLINAITYLSFQMTRTPVAELSTIQGTVYDENGIPFNQAYVSLSFPFAYHGFPNLPYQSLTTSSNGQFVFTGLSPTNYAVQAYSTAYAGDETNITPSPGGTLSADLQLYPTRTITIDYVCQTNGTRNFTTGSLLQGNLAWVAGQGGIKFSSQTITNGEWRDLELSQTGDALSFWNFYVNGSNGLYDAGLVPFASVTEGTATGYGTASRPCDVGHVYVVHTFDGYYAKMIVNTDESSFRTVSPRPGLPIEMAGYDLTLDFSQCSGYGQVYVDQVLTTPSNLPSVALPYYWNLYGLTNLSFTTSLTLQYCPADVATAGVAEQAMAIYQSTNAGSSWTRLATQIDSDNSTLTVTGLTSLGWFAIGSYPPPSIPQGVANYENGQFNLVVNSYAGTVVAVQSSTNLSTWTNVTLLTNTSGTIPFSDAGSTSQKFYRIQLLP